MSRETTLLPPGPGPAPPRCRESHLSKPQRGVLTVRADALRTAPHDPDRHPGSRRTRRLKGPTDLWFRHHGRCGSRPEPGACRVPEPPYRRVHVIINPASGGNEPVLNVLNDVFRRTTWTGTSASPTVRDAAVQARKADRRGVDLVAGYGGDGTQHEIANALVAAAVETGHRTPMGILPGGRATGRPGDGRARHPAGGHRGPVHKPSDPRRRCRPAP